MPGVTLIAGEDFVERADSLVRKQAEARGALPKGASLEDIRRAKRIAETQGQAAANKFLRDAARRRSGHRPSRMGTVVALADLGYAVINNDERLRRDALERLGNPKPDKPKASKRERRPERATAEA